MNETEWLADRFQEHRPRLRAVAYRMLGSLVEAEDAVQDAWVRLSTCETDRIDNLGGWLTTVVARECLHMLRMRGRRREDLFPAHLPDPVIIPDTDLDPEQEALLADSVGLALLVVLDTLTPAERLAFVLHDMFELPFNEIAPIMDRTPAAARQLASRARRRVNAADTRIPDPDLPRQRHVVNAFFTAARAGDFDALVQILDPDVVLRADLYPDRPAAVFRGVQTVAKLARAPHGAHLQPVLVNGAIGALISLDGEPFSLLAFTIHDDKIVEINGIRDPERLRRLAEGTLTPT